MAKTCDWWSACGRLVILDMTYSFVWSNLLAFVCLLTATLVLAPHTSITYARAGMLSRDGRCKTLDERANGIFLYARYAVMELERSVKERDGRPLTCSEIDAFPEGIGEFYGVQLTRLLGRKGGDGKATLDGVELERSVLWRLLRT